MTQVSPVAAGRRLHIGGWVRAPGWEVLDANPGPNVDHVGDAKDLSRFADGCFEEIYASHVLEHLDHWKEVDAALKEWHRVLRPGGTLRVSVPDLDVLARLILDRERLSFDERRQVMHMMFGGHGDEHDYHKAGLNEEFLRDYLRRAGFVRVRPVADLGLFEDSSRIEIKGTPISLNVIAEKPESSPEALFKQAVSAFQGGDAVRARDACERLLAVDPDHPEGLHLQGTLAMRSGNFDAAVTAFRRSNALRPGDVFVLADLGSALAALGRGDEAERCFRDAVAIEPGLAPGHFNLANLLVASAKHEEALAEYREAIRIDPGMLPARVNLGNALRSAGRLAEAETAFREALRLAPGHPLLLLDLGNVIKDFGRLEEAESLLRQAVAGAPGLPLAHLNLGILLEARRDLQGAERCYQEALRLQPDLAEALYGLGNVYQDREAFDQAMAAYHHAIALRPDYADAWNNLGKVLACTDRFHAALEALERARALAPERREIQINAMGALSKTGRTREAVALGRGALQARGDPVMHSALLMFLAYLPEVSREALFEEHLEWARRYGALVPGAFADVNRDPQRSLRIGYLSPDLHTHSVAFFLEPVLARHDRLAFEVFCYGNRDKVDDTTRRLQALAAQWTQVQNMGDQELAARIRSDRIDILVDLAGHTARNRMSVLAAKPAPVQVTWIGYNNTTGLSQVDYRITDALVDPPGESDRFHSERLVRVPGCFCCYQPPRESPAVGLLPAAANGYVTFGCFNALEKLNDPVLELWVRLLREVPLSRLVLKATELSEPESQARLRTRFAAFGIAVDRLDIRGAQKSTFDHLDTYNRVDIGLDPFPYNGVTTTCEALWMGVPVVTLAGRAHAGRTGVSLLTHSGFQDGVAQTAEDYIRIAAGLAGNLNRLAEIRAGMRERMRASTLMDADGHTYAIEAAYREMWRKWCEARS